MAKVRPVGHMRPAKLFFAALEFKGAQNFCKIIPKKCHFWRKFWLFKPKNAIFEENFDFLSQKMTFLKNIFGVSWDFHKSAEKFSKIFVSLNPQEWTCGPQNIKIIENGPRLKKSGHPWSIILNRKNRKHSYNFGVKFILFLF